MEYYKTDRKKLFDKEQSILERVNSNWAIYNSAVERVTLQISKGNTKPMNFGVTGVLTYFSSLRDTYPQSTVNMDLSHMSLSEGQFTGLNLSGSHIMCSDFSHSECDDVAFVGADLSGCNFYNANLDNADF
jgi:uncharacterized protein YjbI with pentapeptide repeats